MSKHQPSLYMSRKIGMPGDRARGLISVCQRRSWYHKPQLKAQRSYSSILVASFQTNSAALAEPWSKRAAAHCPASNQTCCKRKVLTIRAVSNQPFGVPPRKSSGISGKKSANYSGVFWLLLINFVVYTADHVFHLPWVSALYLQHYRPQWWQFLTSAFCHGSWEHISSNAFMLYVFGRSVEEDEGPFGVWATYIICALGSSLASYLLLSKNIVSLGASGAVFGLFAVSVLLKLSFNFKKLLECLVLGQFVTRQLVQEAKMQMAVMGGQGSLTVGGAQIGHLAHLAGALVGVLLVLLLSRLPAFEEAK